MEKRMTIFGGFPLDRWRVDIVLEDDRPQPDERPVGGEMALHVGHRYTPDEIWDAYVAIQPERLSDEEEKRLRAVAMHIRAFAVPALDGLLVPAHTLQELTASLQQTLDDQLGDIAWDVRRTLIPGRTLGPAKKYGVAHCLIEAPIDETTGDAMVLELFGALERPNGDPLGRLWFRPYQAANRGEEDRIDVGLFHLRLAQATYANTAFPNIGVPFYM
jgi:hypothetical protein